MFSGVWTSSLFDSKEDFKIKVISNGTWAISSSDFTVDLPLFLAEKKKAFETFYTKKYKTKKLTWLYQQGYVNITTLFTS